MKKLLAIIVLGLLFSGCQTPYASEGLTGGFSSMKISDNTYRVSYAGNDYISYKKIRSRAKLRAGEIAETNGFDYVSFGNSESYRRRGVTYTVRMYKFDQNINFTKNGKVNCKIKSKGLSRSEAESHVRNKITSCLSSTYKIVRDIPSIYAWAR